MKNIFVGNLSYGATEDTVRSLFEAYGAVDRVSLVTDRETGQARGFGFVEMPVDAEAERAIGELNGRELDGRALNINEARPKENRGGGGGGRGGFGGGGGGGRGGYGGSGGGGGRRNNRY
jgi:cold-inducible RNA-binding protein